MRTLVLDAGYQPHRIVPLRKAIGYLLKGKAEVIEEYEDEVYRSTTLVIKVPAVVRLFNLVRRKKSVKFSRINVATRDNFSCQYCGTRKALRKLNYDHVIPRAQGGRTCWENIVMSCYDCNSRKRDQTPEQAGMRLRKQPVRPASLPVVAFRIDATDSIPDLWASYVYWQGQLDEG